MKESDHDILRRAIDGDSDAMSDLLREHTPGLRKRFRGQIPKRWRSVLTVDDVLQEAFTEAFLDIHQFEPRGDQAFRLWLERVLENNLIDAVRALEAEKRGGNRKRIEPNKDDERRTALYDQVAQTSVTPSRHAAREEACDVLQQAIEQLPEKYRRLVQMYDIEGHALKDVAAAQGRSPGAICMMRRRAHLRLREIMGTAARYFSEKT